MARRLNTFERTMEMQMLALDLQRFAEGGAAGAGGATGSAAAETAGDAARQQGSSAAVAGNGAPAAVQEGGQGAPAQAEGPSRQQRFAELVNGEFKAEADKWFQSRFNRRHADYKAMQEREAAMQPAMALLQEAFGWDGKDPARLEDLLRRDNALWEERAAKEGLSVEQYRKFLEMQAQNRQLMEALQRQQNAQQAAETKARYEREFDAVDRKYPGAGNILKQDFENEQFVRLVGAGVDMLSAFEAIHHEELMSGAIQRAAREAERRVSETVAANSRRPPENGAGSQAPAESRADVEHMSRAERQALNARALRGERVTL